MKTEAQSTAAPRGDQPPPVLEVEDLQLGYRVGTTMSEVIRGLSFQVAKGEAYGLVGESGCGKSTVALAVPRYLAGNVCIQGGSVRVQGEDVLALGASQLRRLRASTVASVYQDPGASLNPAMRIGDQVGEVFGLAGASRGESAERTRAVLERVQIAGVDRVMRSYPHQLSGGMQQRVVIAMALAQSPDLLILDEPTTALDSTLEAEVIDLIARLREEIGASVLFISHNLGLVGRICDRVGVLYAGRLAEEGTAASIFDAPRHPYTAGLLQCVPRWGARKHHGPLETIEGLPPRGGERIGGCLFAPRCRLAVDRCRAEVPAAVSVDPDHRTWCLRESEVPAAFGGSAAARALAGRAVEPRQAASERADDADRAPLAELTDVSKTFRHDGSELLALSQVSLSIAPGEVLGVVGESGCGKSTLAKVLVGLQAPDRGSSLVYDGDALEGSVGKRSQRAVRDIQLIFQDPGESLNSVHSVRRILDRVLVKFSRLPARARRAQVEAMTRATRLDDSYLSLRPRELSGGLKQRVAISRALIAQPRVVVCDEVTSALDVSVQAAILNLLLDRQRDADLSYLFISHDLGVVQYVSDRIAVMYLGRVVEIGTTDDVLSGPCHPYTEALFGAAPTLGRQAGARVRLQGELPSHSSPPTGCPFHTRCPRKVGAICETEAPPARVAAAGHAIHCHIPLPELTERQQATVGAMSAEPRTARATAESETAEESRR